MPPPYLLKYLVYYSRSSAQSRAYPQVLSGAKQRPNRRSLLQK